MLHIDVEQWTRAYRLVTSFYTDENKSMIKSLKS